MHSTRSSYQYHVLRPPVLRFKYIYCLLLHMAPSASYSCNRRLTFSFAFTCYSAFMKLLPLTILVSSCSGKSPLETPSPASCVLPLKCFSVFLWTLSMHLILTLTTYVVPTASYSSFLLHAYPSRPG